MAKKSRKLNLNQLPPPSRKILVGAVVLSALIHLLSYIKLEDFGALDRERRDKSQQERVTVRVVPKQAPEITEKSRESDEPKRILEARQEETEAPDDARYHGAVDHRTDRETRVIPNPNAGRGLDPGDGGRDERTTAEKPPSEPPALAEESPPDEVEQEIKPGLAIGPGLSRRQPRNAYESLMPSANDLRGEVQAGYQDYIDEDLEVGNRIDINTTNYRYMSYFINMRKAFELVWTYPAEAARRGMQGVVRVQFTIMKDGSVEQIQVVQSSGHKILDDAVVEALRLSSPYAPLPGSYEEDELPVTGSFRYVLSSFAGAY